MAFVDEDVISDSEFEDSNSESSQEEESILPTDSSQVTLR